MKAGLIIKLKDGRTIKTIPNLVQILTNSDSCEGCCFSARNGCDAASLPDRFSRLTCGSRTTEPVDEQIIFVEVVKDEGG